jgi:tetratricopeptide (TPR) repeat protein
VRRHPGVAALAGCLLVAVLAAGLFARRAYQVERQRQVEIAAEKRQAAMEKAILAAMSSQFADADAALLEAERLGADLAERRFVAGILKHYRGESDEARRLLLEACGERPDWVAPRAFLAVVCSDLHDFFAEAAHGNAALRLTPEMAEDYLFRGLMVGLGNPRRAMPDVEEAWRRRRSVLAQFVRAQVLNTLADDTGQIEDAVAARDAFQGARPFLGDAPLATATSLYIHCVGCNNCRIHGRDDEAKRWLAEGAADFRAASLGACRNHPQALAARSKYLYLRDDSPEILDAENRALGRRGPESEACRVYLASLLRRGKTDEALEYLQGFPDKSYHLTEYRVAFLMSRDLKAAGAECRRAVADTTRRGWRGYLIYALNMLGLPDEVPPLIPDARRPTSSVADWQELVPFVDRMFTYVYQGRPLDVEEAIAGSRWKRSIAYGTLGFAALGRGQREQARAWFRKANEHPPLTFSSYLWLRAIRERVLADDPVWPPWLATKK